MHWYCLGQCRCRRHLEPQPWRSLVFHCPDRPGAATVLARRQTPPPQHFKQLLSSRQGRQARGVYFRNIGDSNDRSVAPPMGGERVSYLFCRTGGPVMEELEIVDMTSPRELRDSFGV